MVILAFIIVTLIVAATACLLAAKALKKGDGCGRYLAVCLLLSAGVEISYLISILVSDMFIMSFFSSIYFSLIDLLLLGLVLYVRRAMELPKRSMIYMLLPAAYALFDIFTLMINPWKPVSLTYRYSESSIQHWRYVPGHLYEMHLIFSYFLIAIVFTMLIYKAAKKPFVYRRRYSGICIALFFVVFINAVFLFLSNDSIPDISLFLYSIAGFIFYKSRYNYSKRRLLSLARAEIVDEMNHPIILFDYEKKLVLRNRAADCLCENIETCDGGTITLCDFINGCGFKEVTEFTDCDVTFRWIDRRKEKEKSYRCDYHTFKDKKGYVTGYLFVFTDNSMEIDILTGFANMNEFSRHAAEEMSFEDYPACVTVCDINNLYGINRERGEAAGDYLIKKLSRLMQSSFPEGTYFARLNEANLAAVTSGEDEDAIDSAIANIQKVLLVEDDVTMQTAKAIADGRAKDAVRAADAAVLSMRARKMLDKDSAHSNLLDSLVQTLRESDDETEAHVKRTNYLGQQLARRLNLSDQEKSNLSLLCLLHDIGKVGVPLEILNKPGPLSIEEWQIMKSHTEKGYRIAKSSRELDTIAELILYHHESWDGNGYPEGLKGDRIPLLSRIIAIIDTYDAMTSDRVYRKACTEVEAVAELKRCAGTQFDPNLVDEFIEVLQENNSSSIDLRQVVPAEISKDTEMPTGTQNGQPKSYKKSTSRQLMYSRYILNQDEYIIEVDDNFELITGYSRDDVINGRMHQADLIPREDREHYFSLVRQGFEGKREVYMEHRLLRADGRFIKVHCIGTEFFNAVSREKRVDIVITKINDGMFW